VDWMEGNVRSCLVVASIMFPLRKTLDRPSRIILEVSLARSSLLVISFGHEADGEIVIF